MPPRAASKPEGLIPLFGHTALQKQLSDAVTRGEVPGQILPQPSGTHGFGYDPYFFADELGMTLADATTEQKRAVSHRGRAFDAMMRLLRGRGVL